MEEVIPGPHSRLIQTKDTWFWRFMNPGPFSTSVFLVSLTVGFILVIDIKEHVAISIMSVSEPSLKIIRTLADREN